MPADLAPDDLESPAMIEHSFGLACFAFPLQPRALFVTLDDYHRRLKAALDALPEVTSCTIYTLDDSEDRAEHIRTQRVRDDADDNFSNFPGLGFATLAIELAIPREKSRELFRQARLGIQRVDDFGELFRLTIRDGFEMPVAVVELMDDSIVDPSDAVILLREYFASCLTDANGDIRFCALGPSPFHADVFLAARSSSESELAAVNRSNGLGYDNILVEYSLSHVSLEEATDVLVDRLTAELSLFYHFVDTAMIRSTTWRDIASRLAATSHGARGADAALEKLLRDVTEFRASDIGYATQCTHSLRELYADAELSIFRHRLSAQLDELAQYPTQDAIALIQFLEARRLKRMELAVLFLIGLAGGAVGALITRALTR